MSAPRPDISLYAPRITTVKVKEDQVRTVIGSGGKNIRQIISETGVTIDVEDDGTVTIASADAEAAARAVAMVKWFDRRSGVRKIYRSTVKKSLRNLAHLSKFCPGRKACHKLPRKESPK